MRAKPGYISPEGVPPVDDLVVGCQELPGDLHLVDGETVGPAAALLMINKCQFLASSSHTTREQAGPLSLVEIN